MHIKVCFTSETAATLNTNDWLFSGVYSHVSGKISSLCEALSTLLTGERFLSGVSSRVDFKVFFLFEAFSTLLPGEMTSSARLLGSFLRRNLIFGLFSL